MTKLPSLFDHYFWHTVVALVTFKLFLVSDIAVHIRFSPFDDSLYVGRAYAFLTGSSGWGGYDAYVLAKLPSMSYWLVTSRWLGIPYLLGINILYCLAGLVLVQAAAKSGVKNTVLLFAYFVYLFNPITFGIGWALVMREALSSVFTVALLGVSLQILSTSKQLLPWGWILGWGLLFAFGLLLREEDRILWAFFILFASVTLWARRDSVARLIDRKFMLLLLSAPIVLSSLVNYGARSYNEYYYGAPILSDYSEGEFPKLMASLRSIDSPIDNRLVMLPQDVIQRLRPLVPDFVPVLDRLPAPGIQTYSCKLQGVCSEWSNGWMPWWVKMASWESGLTPSFLAGQAYFKSIREQIEVLCRSNKLSCQTKGSGMIPPMELRWFRSYLHEFSSVLSMLIYPTVDTVAMDAQPVNASKRLVEQYQYVTMTSVTENPPLDNNFSFGTVQAKWRNILSFADAFLIGTALIFGSFAIVWRWVMYPGVALTSLYQLCVVFWIYSLIRLLALAYVAVFIGPFEPRIIFSTYTGLGILGILVIWDSIQTHKKFQFIRYRNA
jgi:hypothetical protein